MKVERKHDGMKHKLNKSNDNHKNEKLFEPIPNNFLQKEANSFVNYKTPKKIDMNYSNTYINSVIYLFNYNFLQVTPNYRTRKIKNKINFSPIKYQKIS